MKKIILFPTEFSIHAPNIFHYALELAKRFGAKIIAMNASRKLTTKIVANKDISNSVNLAMNKLQDFTKKYKTEEYQNIEVTHLVVDDFPEAAILQVAQTENTSP